MLSEKEQDIAALRARLRASEELRGGALGRLERLEAQLGSPAPALSAEDAEALRVQLGSRLEALERLAAARGALPAGVAAAREVAAQNGEAAAAELERRVAALERAARGQSSGEVAEALQQLQATQRLVEELRQQLNVSNAGRSALAGEAERWQGEAESLKREAVALRERLATVEREAVGLRERLTAAEREVAPAASAAREAEGLRVRLAEAVAQASLLGSQLAGREADVHRLERRVAELEASRGREELGAPLGSSRRHESTSPADGYGGMPTRALDEPRLGRPLEVPYKLAAQQEPVEKAEQEWWQRPTLPGPTEATNVARQAAIAHVNGIDGLTAAAHAQQSTSLMGTPLGGGPRTPPPPGPTAARAVQLLSGGAEFLGGGQTSSRLTSVASASEFPKLRDPSPQARQLQAASPPQGGAAGAAALLARSQSVPVQVRRTGAATTTTVGSTPSVSLARWAASPVPNHDGGRTIAAVGAPGQGLLLQSSAPGGVPVAVTARW